MIIIKNLEEKEKKVRYWGRISPDVYNKLEELAEKEDVKISKLINYILKDFFERG